MPFILVWLQVQDSLSADLLPYPALALRLVYYYFDFFFMSRRYAADPASPMGGTGGAVVLVWRLPW